MASNLLRFPRTGGDPLLYVQRAIEELNAAPASALCVATALLFLLILIALIRGARLKRRVNALSATVEQLLSENAARYTRHLLNRSIPGDDDFPADAKSRRSAEGALADWSSHQKAP
jgi:hypothetical protein